MGPFVFALALLVPSVSMADGPIYKCRHGVYADNCDKAEPVIRVTRYTLEQWADRSRGMPCPQKYYVRLLSGDLVCQIPLAQITEQPKINKHIQVLE